MHTHAIPLFHPSNRGIRTFPEIGQTPPPSPPVNRRRLKSESPPPDIDPTALAFTTSPSSSYIARRAKGGSAPNLFDTASNAGPSVTPRAKAGSASDVLDESFDALDAAALPSAVVQRGAAPRTAQRSTQQQQQQPERGQHGARKEPTHSQSRDDAIDDYTTNGAPGMLLNDSYETSSGRYFAPLPASRILTSSSAAFRVGADAYVEPESPMIPFPGDTSKSAALFGADSPEASPRSPRQSDTLPPPPPPAVPAYSPPMSPSPPTPPPPNTAMLSASAIRRSNADKDLDLGVGKGHTWIGKTASHTGGGDDHENDDGYEYSGIDGGDADDDGDAVGVIDVADNGTWREQPGRHARPQTVWSKEQLVSPVISPIPSSPPPLTPRTASNQGQGRSTVTFAGTLLTRDSLGRDDEVELQAVAAVHDGVDHDVQAYETMSRMQLVKLCRSRGLDYKPVMSSAEHLTALLLRSETLRRAAVVETLRERKVSFGAFQMFQTAVSLQEERRKTQEERSAGSPIAASGISLGAAGARASTKLQLSLRTNSSSSTDEDGYEAPATLLKPPPPTVHEEGGYGRTSVASDVPDENGQYGSATLKKLWHSDHGNNDSQQGPGSAAAAVYDHGKANPDYDEAWVPTDVLDPMTRVKLSPAEELNMLDDEIIKTAANLNVLHRRYEQMFAIATAMLEEDGYDVRTL